MCTRCIIFFILYILPFACSADTCPSVAEIIERNIPRTYEWTVDDKTTLDDVLSVNKLYAVRIMDQGDYVSCFYTTPNWPLKLDAKPEKSRCIIRKEEDSWLETESGNLVCQEKNLFNCNFRISCSSEE